LPSDTTKHTPP